jgi:hypothetical protein
VKLLWAIAIWATLPSAASISSHECMLMGMTTWSSKFGALLSRGGRTSILPADDAGFLHVANPFTTREAPSCDGRTLARHINIVVNHLASQGHWNLVIVATRTKIYIDKQRCGCVVKFLSSWIISIVSLSSGQHNIKHDKVAGHCN